MNTKHTPGPWSVHGSYIGAGNKRSMKVVATVANMPSDEMSPDEVAANAALVAAAPDLLAALVDAADALLIHCPDAWALLQARAAIAQATGGQS